MAEERQLPDEVARFIADHITSVEQLEILLLLRSAPGEEWSARKVCEAIRTSEHSAARRLSDLEAGGLIVARSASEPFYRYSPSSRELAEAVESLASAYAELRYRVLDAIFSNPISNLHVYADGFRFRKDRGGG